MLKKTTKEKDYLTGKVPRGVTRSPHWAKVRREFLKNNKYFMNFFLSYNIIYCCFINII
jgi:hypothetical protein